MQTLHTRRILVRYLTGNGSVVTLLLFLLTFTFYHTRCPWPVAARCSDECAYNIHPSSQALRPQLPVSKTRPCVAACSYSCCCGRAGIYFMHLLCIYWRSATDHGVVHKATVNLCEHGSPGRPPPRLHPVVLSPWAGLVLSVFQLRVAAAMSVEKERAGKMKTR